MRTTHDERQTNDDDGRQRITIGHLGDSRELNIHINIKTTGRSLKCDLLI